MESPDQRFIRRCSKLLKCIELKGNICEYCRQDLSDTPWNAEFHHLDPNTKDNSISQMIESQFLKIIGELNKCILLCCGCHRKAHFNTERYKKYKKIIKQRMSNIDFYKNKKINEDEVYFLIKKKKTTTEIALLLNSEKRTIRKVIRRIEKKKKEKLLDSKEEYLNAHRKITDEQILNCYKKKIKRKEIYKQFNISSGCLSKRIKRLKDQGLIKVRWNHKDSNRI